MKRNIVIITGSRGEYGYIKPIIEEIKKDRNLKYSIVVTNMHLLANFGNSVDQIEKDGFKIGAKIYNTYDGYNDITMIKSLASFCHSLPEVLERLKPDIVLLAGDRGEQLMASITAAHMKIPVAHIQAGEVSGHIDGVARHAIARFAHIHFASNNDAGQRLLKTGEQPFRIFVTGAPQLDGICKKHIIPKEKLYNQYDLDPNNDLYILLQHPVTGEEHQAGDQIDNTILALRKTGKHIFFIMPNSDSGNNQIRAGFARHNIHSVHCNIPRAHYISFLAHATALVGNSSSGILEAPTFKLPVVNIGTRQNGRLQGKNVINVKNFIAKDIYNAIVKASSEEFKLKLKYTKNPYGDGRSSKRIVKILKEIKLDKKLLNKQLMY